MATISSAGMGSGLPVEEIITKLMSIEKAPVTQLQTKASEIQTKISAFGSLQSSVSSFRDAALALTKSDTWGVTTATSSDATAVSVAAGSSAVPGAYAVSVQSLAATQSVASGTYESSSALVGAGDLSIEVGAWDLKEPGFAARAQINAMSIPISATDTLADVRDKINAAGGGVRASIVTDSSGARLVLSSSSTGAENGFKVTGTGGGAAFSYEATDGSSPMTRTQVAADAKAKVNGLDITSASNTLSDVVQGLTMNLTKVTDPSTIQVNVAQDNTTMKASIQAFVTAYNTLSSSLKSQTKYDEATKTAGTLQGDSTAVALQRQLRSMISSPSDASSVFTTLSQVGVEMQADGSLKVNDTKLTGALSSNLQEVKKLFANSSTSTTDTSTDGIARRMRLFGDTVLGTDGMLTTRSKGLSSTLSANQKQQDVYTQRLESTEKRIRAQYTALDTKMASATALTTYITQQIANWNKSTS
jgi:flagellar hook-associated protein 2